jgi:hypothetical protein
MLHVTAASAQALKHGPCSETAFVGVMILKWMFLVSFYYLSSPKLSSVLYVQLPCVLVMNYAAYDAATRLQACLAKSAWVRSVTWCLNYTVDIPWLWVSRQVAWIADDPGLEGLPFANPLLTRTQGLLLTWLMIQSSVFWIGFAVLAAKELGNPTKPAKSAQQPSSRLRSLKVLIAQACSVQVAVHCVLVMAARPRGACT